MGSCAAPSAKGDDKFITTDYLQQCLRLYESLCQFRSTGVWITTHDWLCERFMLPASQKNNIAEMKRTFLEPALKKINEKTPLKVTYTTEEDGRLLFNFLDKKQ
ncbi:replication initiation protein, partial [Klebsiella pneumoniae]